MKLAIVILNFKTYEMTLKLIENIAHIIGERDVEIVVVDNASPNESSAVLSAQSIASRQFTFIRNSQNAGYAAGNNIGIKYAVENGAEYILISNNDIEIESYECISKMIQLMEQNKKIGAVSPRIISKDGKKDPPLYFERPTIWDMTFGIVSTHKKRFKYNELKNQKIYAPRGSFMLLRTSDMVSIDYLDEGTFLYYEEPILAEKLNKIEKECWLCGEAMVVHNHGKTISTSIKKRNTCKILCKSYKHYLKEYRHFNPFVRWMCVRFRECSYMTRR